MGRYRPPAPKASKYITPEGAAELREELDHLWRHKRPAVTRAVAEAAAEGDRSENAEYIYGKKQLAEIDRRVRHLRKRLDGIRVVTETPSDPTRIYFGAYFELYDEDGGKLEHRLVGPDESSFDEANLSMDSPVGRAVLGRTRGDEIEVEVPSGLRRYTVGAIRYGKSGPDPGGSGRTTEGGDS